MVWHRIDPRYLRQPDPDGLTLAFVDHGERDTGHLLLHLDSQGQVAGFELAHERFLSGRELYAAWDRATGLQIGEVDVHGRTGTLGPRHDMTPLVRYQRDASAADLGRLLGYVKRSADLVEPAHREHIVAVLRAALRES